VRGPTPLIAVSLCALAESSCDPAMCSVMSRSIRSICFWICLVKLRFNVRTEESPKRAPRFCSPSPASDLNAGADSPVRVSAPVAASMR